MEKKSEYIKEKKTYGEKMQKDGKIGLYILFFFIRCAAKKIKDYAKTINEIYS